MAARRSFRPKLGVPLAALALAASAASTTACQIRVGERQDAMPATAPHGEAAEARADWAKKQAEFDATFAAEIADFHAMEADLRNPDAGDPALADRADALRARFLRRCIAESGWSTDACWDGTFARDITEALARLRLRQGDFMAAAAEAYSLYSRPDLRAADVKLWRSRGLACGIQPIGNGVCVPTPRKDLPRELQELTHSAPNHDGKVEWQGDAISLTRTPAGAVFAFRPFLSSASEGRSCGDLEWQRDGAGNDHLVRPCKTEHYGAISEYYPPAVVPASEVGDFKLTKTTSALVLYSPHGKHAGHLFATWKDTGKVTDRGWKVLQELTFRGTPVQEAKPGNP